MSTQPNRLPAEGDHRFKGTEIDRQHPLRFRLDGHLIHGFAGDTVLSAALASGLIGAGSRGGEPLALDERFAPLVGVTRRRRGAAAAGLPMARMPAIDGLDLVTTGAGAPGHIRRAWNRLTGAVGRTASRLTGIYDGEIAPAPWLDAVPSVRLAADIVVIGGGVAGMSAALEAARHGQRITLVEQRPSLGGNAGFFGATGDEEAPEATIDRLRAAIGNASGITVLLRTEAFSLGGKMVWLHQIAVEDGVPTGKVLTVEAPRIILATGVLERLPIFAGNRRPGVVGSLEAYDRAARFGVWIGRRTLLSTTTSIAYRLAAQIKGSAVIVDRVADTRINPQSRFVEISKAYGIPQLQGFRPISAGLTRRSGGGLRLALGASAEGGGASAFQHHVVDQFTVSGGWQPELSLWHMAGGTSRWDSARHALMADGTLDGVALAGSAAGFETAEACRKSGEAAAIALFGAAAPEIDEQHIAPIYETADDATPIAPLDLPAVSASYLDGGSSLVTRPAAISRGGPRQHSGKPAGQWHGLSVVDVAALVQLDMIAAEEAGTIAREHCVAPGDVGPAGPRAAPVAAPAGPDSVPAYLRGRFGTAEVIRVVEAADGRHFDIGCLLYADADAVDPLGAVGVIVGPAGNGRSGETALVGGGAADAQTLWVRDISGATAARLIAGEPLSPVAQTIIAAGGAEVAASDAQPVSI